VKMRNFCWAVLYTGLLVGANAALADGVAAKALATGEMAKLVVLDDAVPVPAAALVDAAGAAQGLEPYAGKWLVLNFWATWCAPCRQEMPSLQRLQAAMPDIAVVPVATGRNSVEGIAKFFAEAGVTDLPALRDPDSGLAHAMGVMGLPVTVIVSPEGQEVARLIGGAEWDSPDALAVLTALMAD
jgi:thiol-disulfide isomerase/thioredoxin